MFKTFAECFTALLENAELHAANGGLVSRLNGQFIYSLHGTPEGEAEPFLGIYRPAKPGVTWQVFYHDTEAEDTYHEFISNPENGELIAA